MFCMNWCSLTWSHYDMMQSSFAKRIQLLVATACLHQWCVVIMASALIACMHSLCICWWPQNTLCVYRVLAYLDKWGHRHKALRAFEWMQLHGSGQHAFDTQDTFLYTRLMTMFSRRSSDCSQALHIFDSMQSRGIKPDLIAYNTAINAAGEHPSIWFGPLHTLVNPIHTELVLSPVACTALFAFAHALAYALYIFGYTIPR